MDFIKTIKSGPCKIQAIGLAARRFEAGGVKAAGSDNLRNGAASGRSSHLCAYPAGVFATTSRIWCTCGRRV